MEVKINKEIRNYTSQCFWTVAAAVHFLSLPAVVGLYFPAPSPLWHGNTELDVS